MIPRLLRAQKKLEKYAVKLEQSSYYLAAQILDSQCRTSFLKDKNSGELLQKGKKKLFLVRKLWERFRNTTSFSASYDTTVQQSKPTSESTEHLSAFHRRRRRNIEEHTRPQSEDEFDLYIKDSPIPLGDRTSIQWWNDPLQRTRFPRLGQLAIEVLSIPGMSDKLERVFSGSRRRVPWDRTKTSQQILE
jgi:hAT family C-terminal dimerisation region